MEPIRILQVVPNMQQGGIENLIMNLYRNIDRSKVQFDFLVHYKEEFYFDKEIEKLGGRIYHFSVMNDKNVIKYYFDLRKFFSKHKNEYKVIHGHMASLAFIYLGVAKKFGINTRIIHSHGTSHLKSLKGYVKFLLFKLAKYNANKYFACSTEAGRYLFGNSEFEIIPNAIELEKFKYDRSVRSQIRDELGIKESSLVIGNIGRFNLQKNHTFIIDIFSKILEKEKNVILLLVGIGELQQEIKEKIEKLKLENNVLLLGVRKDVEKIYQAMDIFLMPSLFEGLPLTGVEAQASKVRCYFSDTITKEMIISDNVEYLPLNLSAQEWCDAILERNKYDRENVILYNNDFDIKYLSDKMEKRYIEYNK